MKNLSKALIGTAIAATAGVGVYTVSQSTTLQPWSACLKPVSSQHDGPSTALVNEVFTWAKNAPEEVFAKNMDYDIYSIEYSKLGPWRGDAHRRAALAETFMVSAAFESDYNWNEGRDMSAHNTSLDTQEAGIVQTSCNIFAKGSDLIALFDRECGQFAGSTCARFITCTKANHKFAIETQARALRHATGYQHWGPILRGVVTAHLRPECISEMEARLK